MSHFKKDLLREKHGLLKASARPQRRDRITTALPIPVLSGKEDMSRFLQTQLIPQSPPHHGPPPSVAPGVGALSLCVPFPYSASGHSDRSSDCSQTPDISFL